MVAYLFYNSIDSWAGQNHYLVLEINVCVISDKPQYHIICPNTDNFVSNLLHDQPVVCYK